MPTSAWPRRPAPAAPVAGSGGRRWPWLVAVVGLLLASGTAVVALDPDAGPPAIQLDDPLAPPTTGLAPLPVEFPSVVTAAGTVSGHGQSVVTPAGGPPSTVARAAHPALQIGTDNVRAADVHVRIPDGAFSEAFDRALSIAPAYGGFVASSSSSLDRRNSAAQIALRVPVDRFDAARRAVSDLGEVEAEAVRGQDVTAQLVDYEARLRSMEAQEEALRTLLGRATTVGEVLQIQPTLGSVRQQIEQTRAPQARLEDAAALSTILVTLREPTAPGGEAPDGEARPGLGRRIEQAVDGALAVVGGMIVAIGWAAPVIAIASVAVIAGRRARRRQAP